MQICYGCMSEYESEKEKCPYCGYEASSSPAYSDCLKPGTLVAGRYLLGRAISRNFRGITYIALDGSINKKVSAIEYFPDSEAVRKDGKKTVQGTGSEEDFRSGVEEFIRNAERLKEFDYYESIVDIYSCFEANNTAYIITEMLEGDTIADLVSGGKIFSYDETVSLMVPILRAVSGLHAAGLVNGNISPETILVCRNGKTKLKYFSGGPVSEDALCTGYAPAEQYDSPSDISEKTDIYSACAVMYYMLTGLSPQDSRLRNTPRDQFVPLCGVADISPSAEDALMKGMAVSVQDRTENIDEIINALTGEETVVYETAEPEPEVFVPDNASPDNEVKNKFLTKAVIAAVSLLLVLIVAVIVIPKVIKRNSGSNNNATNGPVTLQTKATTETENILLPAEIKRKFEEFLNSEKLAEAYPEIDAIRRHNIDLYPEDQAVPGKVSTFDYSTYNVFYVDLDGEGNDECIVVTDTNGRKQYVTLYIFDIDEKDNVIEGGKIEYNAEGSEEIFLCTAKGNQATNYYFLRYTDSSARFGRVNPQSFEILCYNGEELFCAASGGSYSFASDGSENGAGGDYCYTGLPDKPDGAIWDSSNPLRVKSVYAYENNYKVGSSDDFIVTSQDIFSAIWFKSVETSTRKIAFRSVEVVNNVVNISASFPGLNLNNREVELTWRIGSETKPFLYDGSGKNIVYQEEIMSKDFTSDRVVELYYGGRRYCRCVISLDENGHPSYKMGKAELARMPSVTGMLKDEAVQEIEKAGFTDITLKKGARLGLIQIAGRLNHIQKQSIEANEYYPKDTEIVLYYYYI